ncbi:hypothetical protein [Streptomyces sp. N2A]|uniref:hypothetical protein n=1 Tax=Streptomyces sp. N2A TaxID=3073936 RepID=UPI0028700751|nr:hypothetical protein [Streptomyces sp. N2A]
MHVPTQASSPVRRGKRAALRATLAVAVTGAEVALGKTVKRISFPKAPADLG